MTDFLHDICGNGESRERGVNQRPATRSIILQNQPLVMQRMPAHRVPFSERVIATAKQLGAIVQNEIYLRIATVAVGDALRDQMGGNGLAGRHPHGSHKLLPDAPGLTQRAV